MANISRILTTLTQASAWEDLSPIVVETAALYQIPLLALLPRTRASNVKHVWFEPGTRATSNVFNMTQIFQTKVEVSGTRTAVRQHGGNEYSYQLLERFRAHLVEIERALISGRRDTCPPYAMAGLTEKITTHAANRGGPLTEDIFLSFLRGIFADGGNPHLILASPAAMQAVNFWGKVVSRTDDELFGLAYTEYLCEFGLMKLVMSRYVPSGSLFALDPDLVAYAPLDGRDTQLIELAYTDDSYSALIITESTLELCNEYCHGHMYGITGGA